MWFKKASYRGSLHLGIQDCSDNESLLNDLAKFQKLHPNVPIEVYLSLNGYEKDIEPILANRFLQKLVTGIYVYAQHDEHTDKLLTLFDSIKDQLKEIRLQGLSESFTKIL